MGVNVSDSDPKNERLLEFNAEDVLSHVRRTPVVNNGLDSDEKVRQITEKYTEIMNVLGLDLTNDSLAKTPERVARMLVKETFRGLDSDEFPKITVIENEMKYDQMIVVKDVSVMSLCEHHFVTIDGKAHVGYIPKNRVIGLSKINRIADYFARRPQVQERLTKQIADCLCYILDTQDVAVYMEAKHYCVVGRGIEDVNSTTSTCDLRGDFRDDSKTRLEFMGHCTHRLG